MPLAEGGLKAMQKLYDRYMALWILRRFLVLLKEFPRCEKNVLRFASKKGRGDVVRWLVKLFPDTKRSLLYAAEGGHLKLLKWLTKHTSWNEASIRASAGHL
ncbi:Ankyrin repeat-containing domain [Phytophthora cactorum]|nr:Ankyrin repeat-containing domain [Phytophthora cactorum]